MRDEELLQAAGRGDREAFGEFVERHQRGVLRFVDRFLGGGDHETAEDLTQDVFLRAWSAAPRYRPRAKVTTWLYRIALNRCLNHRRHARRRPVEPLDQAGLEPIAGRDTEPEAAMLAKAELEAMTRALDRLPVNQRAALLLRHEQDLPYTDIAEVLETSRSAVETLLYRARRNLAAELAREGFGPPPQVSAGRGVGKGGEERS